MHKREPCRPISGLLKIKKIWTLKNPYEGPLHFDMTDQCLFFYPRDPRAAFLGSARGLHAIDRTIALFPCERGLGSRPGSGFLIGQVCRFLIGQKGANLDGS